jgi:hypothetical protein
MCSTTRDNEGAKQPKYPVEGYIMPLADKINQRDWNRVIGKCN